MAEINNRLSLGRTEIELVLARPLSHASTGIFVPGNQRAVMAAGLAGEVRVRAGRTVEDELLALRPLGLGNSYPTRPGNLVDSGVQVLVHGIVCTDPGQPARADHTERALRTGLIAFEERGVRSITIPHLTVISGKTDAKARGQRFGAILQGHMRRGSRIDKITVAGLDRDFAAGVRASFVDAGAIPIPS